MDLISVEGAYDLHVHSAPCIYPRLADDLTVAETCARAGLCGVVLKSHHESTVGRAAVANAALARLDISDCTIFGSITLNNAVGGVNSAAVEAALTTGARIVWMPTVDSRAHLRTFGHLGSWDVQGDAKQRASEVRGRDGLTVLNEDGSLTDETVEIVGLCKARDVALATGHLGPAEVLTLARFAHENAFNRLIVTHPNFRVPGLDLEAMLELASLGAHFEFTYCTVSPMWRHATVDETVAAIQAVGVEHCYLSSDAGQLHNPMPHEGLRLLAQMVHERGISADEIRQLITVNPAHLVEA